MVNYTEGTNGQRQFEGIIESISTIEAEGKYPSQYKIDIVPTSENAKEWKNQTIYISIPSTATPTDVPKKSFLGFMCKILEDRGLKAETYDELIKLTLNKKMKFEDTTPKVDGEIITKKDKLVWVDLVGDQ